MGVLNFPGTFHQTPPTCMDVLSFAGNLPPEDADSHVDDTVQNTSRNKRKRTKSGCKPQYNFEDYGIDDRRRGSKHQRRKQNFYELQELVGGDELLDEPLFLDNQMTVFTELFLDESKMKIWEGFIALSEDKQGQYIEEFHARKVSPKPTNGDACRDDKCVDEDGDEMKYLLIDSKIRDMLRSKQLANNVNGVLKYYEDDVLSCVHDVTHPAVLILDVECPYDRMLVYAVCQYMKLSANTIKLKTTTLVEIDLDEDTPMHSGIALTEYLKTNISSLR